MVKAKSVLVSRIDPNDASNRNNLSGFGLGLSGRFAGAKRLMRPGSTGPQALKSPQRPDLMQASPHRDLSP